MPPTPSPQAPVRADAARRANDAIRSLLTVAARQGRELDPQERDLYQRLLATWCEAQRQDTRTAA